MIAVDDESAEPANVEEKILFLCSGDHFSFKQNTALDVGVPEALSS